MPMVRLLAQSCENRNNSRFVCQYRHVSFLLFLACIRRFGDDCYWLLPQLTVRVHHTIHHRTTTTTVSLYCIQHYMNVYISIGREIQYIQKEVSIYVPVTRYIYILHIYVPRAAVTSSSAVDRSARFSSQMTQQSASGSGVNWLWLMG